jgi:hypothetical protein
MIMSVVSNQLELLPASEGAVVAVKIIDMLGEEVLLPHSV